MKIKTWLLLSYFVVMVLPLVSLYLLFASVTNYQSDQKVEEYSKAYTEIQEITEVLLKPKWYEAGVDKERLDSLAKDGVAIQLYNQDGLILYHSLPDLGFQGKANRQQLYKHLYEVEEGMKAYTYREPVFDDGQLIGFFDIEIARNAWVGSIIKRGWVVTALFLVSFFLVYFTVSYIVNQRVTKRLYGLMNEMTAFADGKLLPETKAGKDEIGELKGQFYRMRNQIATAQDTIKKEQEEKEFMVAAISHDLKTPLTSIKAYAEALNEPTTISEEEQVAYQRVIIEKSDFIQQMLDDLMTYSLLQSRDYDMDVVTVDGEEFFEMLLSDYDALCKKHHLQLNTYCHAPGEYDVHPQQMIRVVDNLMGNAIKHTPARGTIWLLAIGQPDASMDWLFAKVRSAYSFDFDRYMYLMIQNEGTGIHEDSMEQLFQPLYQVDAARTKQDDRQGNGLGLSITKQIMERHGGDVTVISETAYGTCFICRLPKRRSSA